MAIRTGGRFCEFRQLESGVTNRGSLSARALTAMMPLVYAAIAGGTIGLAWLAFEEPKRYLSLSARLVTALRLPALVAFLVLSCVAFIDTTSLLESISHLDAESPNQFQVTDMLADAENLRGSLRRLGWYMATVIDVLAYMLILQLLTQKMHPEPFRRGSRQNAAARAPSDTANR